MSDFIKHHQWLYSELGSGANSDSAAQALAWQDAFIRIIPNLQKDFPTGIIHCYQLDCPSVLLGPKDMRLNNLQDGIKFLEQEGYTIHLRAHGGLAVVSDPGVINISFINETKQFPLSIDQAYEQLIEWVRLAIQSYQLEVESYEIADSYCPGTYDIVVNQKKIGGIAQRRFKSGVATAAYISVSGNQSERANLIRKFYEISQANDDYPIVNAHSMATLNDFLNSPITTEEFLENLQSVIYQSSVLKELDSITPEQMTIYQQMHQKALERNQTLYSN